MRKFLLLVAMAVSLTFATAPVAMAQSDVDVEAAAEAVLNADQDALMTALETPIPDEDLPEAFSNAAYVDPETASGEEGALPASGLEGAEGSVAYAVDFDPAALAAADSAQTSSEADAFSIGLASLNYVFMSEEITIDDLEDFKAGAEEALAEEAGVDASPEAGAVAPVAAVEDIQVGGVDGVLITYLLNEEGVQSVVQMVAIPVGNTVVVSMTVQAGTEVDADAVLTASEDLALAGVDYLGTVAESAQ